ncbi:MAG: PTS glucose transporter subunit IIA [Turicibacter sp.]|nr:PTS glucose transporter subunit IIA [Turicibacter sp.]
MGLMNIFSKNSKKNVEGKKGFFSPMSGEIISLSEVPDPVFSEKMMGDGFAIEPSEGKLYSPATGIIKTVFPTKHAIGLVSDEGREILIHIGMDTVTLNGDGFTSHVKEGQKVNVGELLVSFELEKIRPKVPAMITPIIFTNLNGASIKVKKSGRVEHGEGEIIEIL